VAGTDARIDRAIAMMPKIRAFLRQLPNEDASFEDTVAQLSRLAMEAETDVIRAERTAA